MGSLPSIGARIRERLRGLYDRTRLYPAFPPPLDHPGMATLAREFAVA